MYLRAKKRFKDGKEHRYWSIVESCRQHDGRVVQRQVLYLGEINDSEQAAWCKSIAVLQEDASSNQMALFPTDRQAPPLACDVVQVKLNELQLHHPRQWGACWLVLSLWDQLELDSFWRPRLPVSRQGTKWLDVLKTQVCYQLIDPGSEWRLHRHWYEHSAMQDLLGSPLRVMPDDNLYRCLDKLLAHKCAFFSFLRARWESLNSPEDAPDQPTVLARALGVAEFTRGCAGSTDRSCARAGSRSLACVSMSCYTT